MRRFKVIYLLSTVLMWLAAIGCGGSSSPGESCSDAIKNQFETDVDCGGTCQRCGKGQACIVDKDCASGNCESNLCAPAAETCIAGETRCTQGGDLETCLASGDGWDLTACAQGCAVVAGQADCIQDQPDCTNGETRCTADGNLQTCDASEHWQETVCDQGCELFGGQSRCISDQAIEHHAGQLGGIQRSSGARFQLIGGVNPSAGVSSSGTYHLVPPLP